MGWQVVDVPGGHHFGKERVFCFGFLQELYRGDGSAREAWARQGESDCELVSCVRVSSEARSFGDQVRSSAGSRVSFVRVCLV